MTDEPRVNVTEEPEAQAGQPAPAAPSQERTPAVQPDYGDEIQALRQELATLRSQQQSTRDQVTNALSKRLRDEFTSIDRLAKRNNWSAAEIADQKAKARAEALDAIATEEPAAGTPGVPPGTPPPVTTAAYPAPATQNWEVQGAASKAQSAAAILDYVADYDLQDDDPETAMLIARYSGKQYSSPAEYRAMLREFKRDVHKQVAAKDARLQQEQVSGQRRAEATEARAEVERHGALGNLSGGGLGSALTPERLQAELDKLLTQEPPSDPKEYRAFNQRMDELEQKLKNLHAWK